MAERIWDEYVREDIDLYMTYLAKAYNAYPFNQSEQNEEHKAYLLNVHSTCLSHKKMLERIVRLLRDDNTRPDKYAVNQISNWKHILDKLSKRPDILCPINEN